MSQRKSIIVAEESNVASPSLRRSSRIASSPAPAAIGARRSSATTESVSTPAKIAKAKRLSLSQDISEKKSVDTPKRAASVTKDDRPITTTRGRRPSITKEDLVQTTQRVSTPARKSLTASTLTAESVTPKPRGRRPSVTEKIVPLESINESEPKEINKPVARGRRSSATSQSDPVEEESKKPTRAASKRRLSAATLESIEEKVPAVIRRSTRRSSKSPSKTEDEKEEPEDVSNKKKVKLQELNSIIETSFVEEDDVFAKSSPRRSTRPRSITPVKCCDEVLAGTPHIHSPKHTPGRKSVDGSPKELRSSSKSPSLSNEEIIKDVPIISESPINSRSHRKSITEADSTENKAQGDSTTMEANVESSPKLSKSIAKEPSPKTERIYVNLTPKQRPNEGASPVKVSPNLLKSRDEVNPKLVVDNIKQDTPEKTLIKEFKSPKSLKKTDTSDTKSLLINELEMTSGSDGSFHLNISIPVSNSSQEDENNIDLQKEEEVLNTSGGSDNSDKENLNKAQQMITKTPLNESDSKKNTPLQTIEVHSAVSQLRRSPRSPKKDTSTPNSSKRNQSFFEPMDVEYASDVEVSMMVVKDNSISENVVSSSRKSLNSSLNQTAGNYDCEDVEDEEEHCTSPVKQIKKSKISADIDHEDNLDVQILSDSEADESQQTLLDSFVDEVQDDGNAETSDSKLSDSKSEKRKSLRNEKVHKKHLESDSSKNLETESSKKHKRNSSSDSTQIQLGDGSIIQRNEKTEPEIESEAVLNKSGKKSVLQKGSKKIKGDGVNNDESLNSSDEETADIETIESSDNDEDKEKVFESLKNPNISQLKRIISIDSSENEETETSSLIKDSSVHSELSALIAKKLIEDSSSDDDDYVPRNKFVDDQAFEGEEDTPSEGSNDIIEDGESLHSTDTEAESVEEEYEEELDSFICDDASDDLLSGDEYDLGDEKKKKKPQEEKRKSRIITVIDSSDDEKEMDLPEKLKKDVLEKKDDLEAATDLKTQQVTPKINIIQDIKLIPKRVDKSDPSEINEVINENDNLLSLENIKNLTKKDSLQLSTPKSFPESVPNTPINTDLNSSRRNSRRKTSISIQENIKVASLNEAEINEKITKAVDFFCSSIKRQSGNISLNMSLDYTGDEEIEETLPEISLKANPSIEDENQQVSFYDFTVEDSSKASKVINKRASLIQEFNVDKSSPLRTKKRNSLQPKFIVEDLKSPNVGSEKTNSSRKQKRRSLALLDNNQERKQEKRETIHDETESPKQDIEEHSQEKTTSLVLIDNIEPKQDKRNSRVLQNELQEPRHKRNGIRIEEDESSPLQKDNVILSARKEKRKSSEVIEEFVEKKKKCKKIKSAESPDILSDSVFDTSATASPKTKSKNKKKNQFVPTTSNNISYFPPNMLEECVDDARVSVSEISELALDIPKITKNGNSMNIAPSKRLSMARGWQVEESEVLKPSKKNKNKTVVGKSSKQPTVDVNKFLPNDFRRRMMYDSKIQRTNSKDIIKNKSRNLYRE